jgi:hypothetical protein
MVLLDLKFEGAVKYIWKIPVKRWVFDLGRVAPFYENTLERLRLL